MIHGQVLKYLRRAHEAGLVQPVFSDTGGRIRGWAPASAEATTVAEQKARRVAKAVQTL